MHCVSIGVMKKLLLFWTGSPKHVQTLPSNIITLLDERFNKLAEFTPDEFFVGCVVFKGILSNEAYNHFLELFIAIQILVKDNCSEEYNKLITMQINFFKILFTLVKTVYGKTYFT